LDVALDLGPEMRPDTHWSETGQDAPPVDTRDAGDATATLALLAGALGGAGDLDGIGTAARFNGPSGVVSDGHGTLWVADTGSHIIRQIVVATGAVTTLAGSAGKDGVSDGTGADARFRRPANLARDGAGNLFIADSGNDTIRKLVLATGAVTTLAGSPTEEGCVDGTGPEARFSLPQGLAYDGNGSLFVADSGNHVIRQALVATGEVRTIAGWPRVFGSRDDLASSATFNFPVGLTIDGGGDLFIADLNNHVIRQLTLSTGEVTTLAGSSGSAGSTDGIGGDARFTDPAGIAGDGAGTLFVTDFNSPFIRAIAIASKAVTTLAGAAGTAEPLNAPVDLTWDGSRGLFIADSNTIRTLDVATGAVGTLAGASLILGASDGTGSAASFQGPAGMASDEEGNLFVVDNPNNAIRRIDHVTSAVTTLAGSAEETGSSDGIGSQARFNSPWGVASDHAGHLFVSDYFNCTIRRIDVASAEVTTIAGTARTAGETNATGSFASFTDPTGLAMDDDGNLYIVDGGGIRSLVVATGKVTTLVKWRDARFNGPHGIAYDGAGSLFVADTQNNAIWKIVIATGAAMIFAGATSLTEDSAGSTNATGTSARFFEPYGIAADRAGNLYVADHGNHAIRKIVIASAAVTTVIGSPNHRGVRLGRLPAGLSLPTGLALGPAGQLFIADEGENAILVATF